MATSAAAGTTDLRRRGPADTTNTSTSKPDSHIPTLNLTDPAPKISLFDILRILGGLLLVNCTLSYFITGHSVFWGARPWFTKPILVQQWLNGPLRLTDSQLGAYDGTDAQKPIYLALNGTIYDVSAGKHAYGPGGSYHFFSGRDATRAFVTGCFDVDLIPDIRGIEEMYIPIDDEESESEKQMSAAQRKVRKERDYRLARQKVHDSIDGWAKMFRGEKGKEYFEVGRVVRKKDWLEKRAVPELCERAKNLRKKRRPGQ